jgi:hypothetical protein
LKVPDLYKQLERQVLDLRERQRERKREREERRGRRRREGRERRREKEREREEERVLELGDRPHYMLPSASTDT